MRSRISRRAGALGRISRESIRRRCDPEVVRAREVSSVPRRRRHRPRKRGRKRRWRLTPARLRAARVAAWKHGLRAQVVTRREVLGVALDRKIPGATAACDAYLAAAEGEFAALDPLHVEAMAESELLRREMVREVQERGVLVEEALIDKDGRAAGTRIKANPVLEPMRRFSEILGHTADQLRLTPKSRGEESKSVALAAAFRLQRDAQLRALDHAQRLPPPPKS
jgi:hypothetical protein